MGGATEMLEKMEHAAHAGGHHGGGHGDENAPAGPGKMIGITMAIMGVLLALCAAMVGSERTELVKTMVEQSNVWGEYQSESIKYRAMLTQLQMLHAVTPNKAEVEKFNKALEASHATAATTTQAPVGAKDAKPTEARVDNTEVVNAIKLSTQELSDILSPDLEDAVHFVNLIWKYRGEREEAREWFESYESEVNAHFRGSELYEKAQLASEIGIVIASIALLLASRPFWYIAVVAGLACAAIIGFTWYTSNQALNKTCDEEKDAAHPEEPGKLWSRFPLKEGEKADSKLCQPGAMQWIAHEKETYELTKKKNNSAADDDKLIAHVIDSAREHNKTAPADKQIALPSAPHHGAGAEHGAGGGHGGGGNAAGAHSGGGGDHPPAPPASSGAAPAPHAPPAEHH